LANNNILSAPFVIQNKVIFVDVLMILSAFVKHFNSKDPNSLTYDIKMKDSMPWFNNHIKESGLLESNNSTSQHVSINCSMSDAANKLFESKFHRIALVNDHMIPEDIFSQSDLVYLFYKQLENFSDFQDGPIDSLGIITKPVITISDKKISDECVRDFID